MEVSDVEWKSKGSEMKQDVSRWMGLEVDGNFHALAWKLPL